MTGQKQKDLYKGDTMIKDDPRLDENYCIRPLNYESLYSIALDENNRLKGQIEELEEVIEYLEEEIQEIKSTLKSE